MKNELIAGFDPGRDGDLILINSPLRNYGVRPKDDYEVLPPLGLAYIATQAAFEGHNVGLIDAEHHGIDQVYLADVVNELNPRYVGINVFTPNRLQSLHFAENLNPDIPLIIGGPHATALAERTLREFFTVHERIILIKSEAELAVAKILDGQSVQTISGAFWLERGVFMFVPGLSTPNNLNELPQLDRKFLANDPSIDRHTGKIESRMLTSRGCPFNCTICAGAREALDLPVRSRYVENVAREIRELVVNDGVQSVRFVDDLFISSERRAMSILDAMEADGISDMHWDATGRANILAKFSPEFFDYLKRSGANEIAIGIESGSDRLRQRINKQVSLREIQKSIRELTSRGIKVKGYFVIGIPTETKVETQSTLNLARKLTLDFKGDFRASIFIFRPYPGTKEWKDLINLGFSEDDLLSMSADEGTGERAKHEVLTTRSFGERSVSELSDLLSEYGDWQKNALGL